MTSGVNVAPLGPSLDTGNKYVFNTFESIKTHTSYLSIIRLVDRWHILSYIHACMHACMYAYIDSLFITTE